MKLIGDGLQVSKDSILAASQLRREAERLERKAKGNAFYAEAAKEARQDYERFLQVPPK